MSLFTSHYNSAFCIKLASLTGLPTHVIGERLSGLYVLPVTTLHLHPCTTRELLAHWLCQHKIPDIDNEVWLNFVNWDLHGVHAGEIDPTLILFSDKSLCHLSGHVNTQKNSYWSAENLILIHEVPLCDMVGVCSALIATMIIYTHSDNIFERLFIYKRQCNCPHSKNSVCYL
jgi:hypothetical protein